MTEPEQWAVELWRKACHDYGGASIADTPAEWRAVMAIQHAFEQRDRKLRDACDGIDADYMTSEKHHPGYVLIPTVKFQAIIAARQALSPTSEDQPCK